MANDGVTNLFYTFQDYLVKMLDEVEKALEGHEPQIFIVPYPGDLASTLSHPLPQPHWNFPELQETKSFRRRGLLTLPNPCSLSLNGLLLGIMNADIIKDLMSSSIVKQPSKNKQTAVLPLIF